MSGQQRCYKQGFSLVEILIVATLTILFISYIAATSQGRTEKAKVNRVVRDSFSIVRAGVMYRDQNGSWPTQLTDLHNDLVGGAVTTNIYGNSFSLSSTSQVLTVCSNVPDTDITLIEYGTQVSKKDVGGGLDQICVAKIRSAGPGEARLRYEKKYY